MRTKERIVPADANGRLIGRDDQKCYNPIGLDLSPRPATDQGELRRERSSDETAWFIISAWQGALVRIKATAGPEPLDNFQTMVFKVLLA